MLQDRPVGFDAGSPSKGTGAQHAHVRLCHWYWHDREGSSPPDRAAAAAAVGHARQRQR